MIPPHIMLEEEFIKHHINTLECTPLHCSRSGNRQVAKYDTVYGYTIIEVTLFPPMFSTKNVITRYYVGIFEKEEAEKIASEYGGHAVENPYNDECKDVYFDEMEEALKFIYYNKL